MTRLPVLLSIFALALAAGGCELAGDILELGVWVLVLFILFLVVGMWGLLRVARGRFRRGPRS